ncbi:polysaccharide biosynthesis tyrosine autokinase [Clostridium sp. MCC353]|uniref:CpsD/CapB family tyrosine-protein kinase n=1 Tax=Clostridium sp. MCC353 TaxID=2592646 RepID=UPI001C034451|nr:CpsD/CapB family tyrosine-protein kinase [Clostridium sp. MCC353]MBT9777070.1 polysaccharide biosynthesis tyrosine autokinase [Clostridium sp. MCC353]
MENKISLSQYEVTDYNFVEAIKTLRTNIQFSGSSIRLIMFTSSVSNEGKSEISFQLAASLAQLGKHVLLIDADIRKSVLVSRYQPDREVNGLSQYLSSQITREEAVYQSNVNGLEIMFAGPYSPNPAELLEEEQFGNLLDWARDAYDYVVIDTPPMGNLIDGAIVARHCDGVVMVIESGAISFRLLQKVKAQLEKSGCRILGTVLNKITVNHCGYYRYYGKYGRYGKYGKEYEKAGKRQ